MLLDIRYSWELCKQQAPTLFNCLFVFREIFFVTPIDDSFICYQSDNRKSVARALIDFLAVHDPRRGRRESYATAAKAKAKHEQCEEGGEGGNGK